MKSGLNDLSAAASTGVSVGEESVIERLRRGMAEAGLDCHCRETANEILDKVGAAEQQDLQAQALAEARRMRDAIFVVLALLGELDELDADEPDRTVFQEMATLFQDVSDFAAHGVISARRAAGRGEA